MTSHQEIRKRYLEQFGGLITHPLANGLWNFIESELSSSATKIREGVEKLPIYTASGGDIKEKTGFDVIVTHWKADILALLPSEGDTNPTSHE